MDLPSRSKWYAYSRARDQMLESTDTEHAPWHIVRSDDKRRARLNLIAHFLSLIPYKELPREKVELPGWRIGSHFFGGCRVRSGAAIHSF